MPSRVKYLACEFTNQRLEINQRLQSSLRNFSLQIEKTFAYNIEVKNLKSTNIDLIIQDQIPITQNADIIIEATNTDKAKLYEKTGVLEWTFDLKTKETKNIGFNYKLKYNKDLNLPL